MTELRPVTAQWPSTSTLWEDTSLPLSVVIAPVAEMSKEGPSRVLKFPAPTVQPNTKLTHIPKCLNCGAPHPPGCSASHNARILRNTILCYLCGKTSPTIFEEQAAARRRGGEVLIRDEYNAAQQSAASRKRQEEFSTRYPRISNVDCREFALALYQQQEEEPRDDNDKDTNETPAPILHDCLPVHTCPPLYWIVVDGTCDSHLYWNTLGTVLAKVTHDMPSHVHVGLLLVSASKVSLWDLRSPVPHVRHIGFPLPPHFSLPMTPATHLPAALRALADRSSTFCDSSDSAAAVGGGGGMPLGATLEAILDTLHSQEHTHPGNYMTAPSSNTNNGMPTYAGGRVLCLLSKPPVEIAGRAPPRRPVPQWAWNEPPAVTTNHGTGGRGGTCAVEGERWSRYDEVEEDVTYNDNGGDVDDPEMGRTTAVTGKEDGSDIDEDNMTPLALQERYPYTTVKNVEAYFAELGAQFAEAALGVDIVVLHQEQPSQPQSPDVGLPLLRHLSDRSGAPGPLLLCLPRDVPELERELAARTPWRTGHDHFGVVVRLRTSPGFHVDAAPVEASLEDGSQGGPQLAPLYASGGCMGPATAVEEGLWNMGVCEAGTSLTVDLKMDKAITKDHVRIDRYGDVQLSSALQTCVAYTTIVEQPNGSTVVVRRMRVTSRSMPLAQDTETLFASLDPEALAVVLFHKLSIASLQDGLDETQDIGQSWLKSLMVCAYQSAEQYELRQQANAEHGLPNGNTLFYPQERLLNRPGGDLPAEDVVLGQGHERLRDLPLMVFGLLQSDVLRPSGGSFRPTLDARCAASAQLYSMPPHVLARCIAPNVELWGQDSQEPIVQQVDLCLERLQLHVKEHSSSEESLAVLVDSPREVMVLDSRLIVSDSIESDDAEFELGEALQRTIEFAVDSYRVPPPVIYALDSTAKNESAVRARLSDTLLEDSLTAIGRLDFAKWKRAMAEMVAEDIEEWTVFSNS